MLKLLGVVNIDGTNYSIYAGDEGTIAITHQQLRRRSNDNDFVIGDIGRSGTQALASTSPIISFVPPSPPVAPVVPVVVTVPAIAGTLIIFAVILDAGGFTPRHKDEINPISGQPYADEAEFELVNALTDSQDDEVTKFINIPTYGLSWDYFDDNAQFGTVTDEEGNKCLEIPLPIHLGRNINNHHDYADHVIGTKDYILIPPKPILNETSAIYDGRVQIGAAATRPSPLPSQSFDAVGSEPKNALGEVKTGHRFLLRIINGNPLPANRDRDFPSDEKRFEDLIDEIRGEALIAQACGEQYFISFDIFGVARAGASLINSRLASEGINPVRVRYIESPYS